MPSEGIEGDEWGAYVVLARFPVTEHGMACRTRVPRSRSANSTRGSHVPPGRTGEPCTGGSGTGGRMPGAVRYARCGTPKQDWSWCEHRSQEATGELLEIERLTSSLERGHWKSTREGNSLVAYSTSRTGLTGGCDMKSFQSLLCLTFGYDTTCCSISSILRRCAGR